MATTRRTLYIYVPTIQSYNSLNRPYLKFLAPFYNPYFLFSPLGHREILRLQRLPVPPLPERVLQLREHLAPRALPGRSRRGLLGNRTHLGPIKVADPDKKETRNYFMKCLIGLNVSHLLSYLTLAMVWVWFSNVGGGGGGGGGGGTNGLPWFALIASMSFAIC